MSKEKVIKFLEPLYSDITPETIDSVPKERIAQYNRDMALLLGNYTAFSEYKSRYKNPEPIDVSSAIYNIKRLSYLRKLFPGYEKLSPRRKTKCNNKIAHYLINITELDIIYRKLNDPKDPMYQPNLSEKERLDIALTYTRAYIESKESMVISHMENRSIPTSEYAAYLSGLLSYKDAEEFENSFINYRSANESEQLSFLEMIISKYNNITYTAKDIVEGTKQYKINIQDAIAAKLHIDKALNPAIKQVDKNDTKGEKSL